MVFTKFTLIGSTILFVLMLVNSRISIEIMSWVKPNKRRFTLLALLWLAPIIGAYVIYQKDDVTPVWDFNPNNDSTSQTVAGVGMLALETFFNPGAQYLAKVIQGEKVVISEKRSSEFNGYSGDFKTLKPYSI